MNVRVVCGDKQARQIRSSSNKAPKNGCLSSGRSVIGHHANRFPVLSKSPADKPLFLKIFFASPFAKLSSLNKQSKNDRGLFDGSKSELANL